jgi:phospholipid transport system substrate-binding protein
LVVPALLCPVKLFAAGEAMPIDTIKLTVDEVVKVVESLPGDANGKARRAKIKTVLEPRFDFIEMAKRSLGANWNTISKAQQDEFTTAFSKLLSNTYVGRIENVKRDMVNVKTESVDGEKSIVKTDVTHKGDTFPIDYRLMNRNNTWLVYDVVIENISLVANYRNEFAGIMRREKFEGLMSKITTKNKGE